MLETRVIRETWPLTRPFAISRLTITDVVTLRVVLTQGRAVGHGESEPHESDEAVRDAVERQVRDAVAVVAPEMSLEALKELLPSPTARNAVDCALWDLRAKRLGTSVWKLAGLEPPRPLTTAMTIGIAVPDVMGERARALADCGLIKVKLGRTQPIACIEAVRRAVPQTTLTVDANEAWTLDELREYAPRLAALGVALIEQPVPADRDDELIDYRSPVPLCADEACDDLASLEHVDGRYQYINIKLDKTGGFSEALLLAREGKLRGLGIMTGCNVSTSLSMAPAFYIGQLSSFVDIDGASMLSSDREPGLRYDLRRGRVEVPAAELWG